MPQAITCPEIAELKRIALGEYSASTADDLLSHVETCPNCVQQLGTLLAEDTLVEAIRSKATEVDSADHQALARLVAKVHALLPETKSLEQTADLSQSVSASGADTPVFSWVEGLRPETEDDLAPPQAPDEMGRLGSYRILSVLGEGGMGKVYLAEDPNLQRTVALKVMKPSLAINVTAKQRFVREARLAAKIEHDNIVPIYQVGEERGIPFLAMQLLKGANLEDMLKRTATLNIKQVLRIGVQIADGLAAAHERGMIHRDIKPANIWIEPTGGGRVKILDFGLARISEGDIGITQSGAILGTPAYMAPEQARGEKVDQRCDLYSLGCVLYRMATGALPIRGNDTMSMLMALALHEPAAANQINAQVPPALSDLIMKLLSKDPEHRFASAQEVAQALRAIDRGEPAATSASAPTAVLSASQLQLPVAPLAAAAPEAKKPMRSFVMLVIASVAAVLLLLGGAVVYQLTVRTPNGTLVVEVEGDADVRFKQGKLHIFDEKGNLKYVLEPNDKSKILPAGKYQIKVTGSDGLKVDTEHFEMTTAGAKVRVTLEKISLAKGAEDEPKVAPHPSYSADKDKPFVILRNDKVTGEFQGFAAAVAALANGDILEIQGNGPFAIGGIRLDGKSLHLRAGVGYRPKLIPHRDWLKNNGGSLFFVDKAPLTVEGCDVESMQPPSNISLFGGGGGIWRFDHCRLAMADSHNSTLISYNGPQLAVSNSMLIQHHAHATIIVTGKAELEFANNVIYSSAYTTLVLAPDPEGEKKITLRNNSFHSAGILVGVHNEEQKKPKPLVVYSEGNVFGAVTLLAVRGEEKAQFDKIEWQGKDNTYVIGKDRVFIVAQGGQLQVKDWEAWRKHVGKGEQSVKWLESSPYAWFPPRNQAGLNTMAPLHARLAKADVGPDMALVGPGNAYLAALKKRGVSVAQRAKPHADGPFVLLRKGKEMSGHESLDKAWELAKNGDVIEIRTDDPIAGTVSNVGMERTLRAGPGYHPAVTSELRLHPDDQVSIEGITFRDAIVRNLEVKDGRARFVNCAFEGRSSYVIDMSVSAAKPVEIEHCIVAGGVHFNLAPGAKLRLDHSYFHQADLGIREGKTCEVNIERCAAMAEPNGPAIFNAPSTGRITFSAKESWFESLRVLDAGEKTHVEWRGEKNVFAAGGGGVLYHQAGMTESINGLPAWQKYFNADADSTSAEPVFYHPQHWRLRGSQAGGANIDRILASKPIGVQAPLFAADKEKPFVLVRSSKIAGEFKAFAGVVPNLQDNDIIEVHGNGPFIMGKIEVTGKRVILRAAENYRPRFLPHLAVFAGSFAWITFTDGDFTVEGCDFVGRPPQGAPANDHIALLFGKKSNLTMRNCRILGLSHVGQADEKRLHVEDCLLIVGQLPGLWGKAECHFQSNIVYSSLPFLMANPGGQRLTLVKNTFCSHGGGFISVEPKATDVAITAEGNLFDFASAWGGASAPFVGLDWRKRATWHGRNNLYRNLTLWTETETHKGLDGWNKLIGITEKDSRETAAEALYELERFKTLTAKDAMPILQIQMNETRHHTKSDAGPDFALLGPGDAYLKALAIAGKAVTQEKLRPEAEVDGACVLLRGSKVAGAFTKLDLAVAQAKDGDTVEIRSDGTFGDFQMGVQRGIVTVRAAYGYRPTIENGCVDVKQGSILVLEGMHFRNAIVRAEPIKDVPTDQQPRIARLANCSFEWTKASAQNWGIFRGVGKLPGEIVNCWMPFPFEPVGTANSALLVGNSVLGTTKIRSADKGPFHLNLERAIVWNTKYAMGETAITVLQPHIGGKYDDADVKITSRGTLFESAQPLVNLPNTSFEWEGAGNAFRIGTHWIWGTGCYGLNNWPTQKNRKETGSVEADPAVFAPDNWRLLPAIKSGGPIGANIDRIRMFRPNTISTKSSL